MLYAPKKTVEYPNLHWGVCVWKLPNGTVVQNDNGDHLVVGPCRVGNHTAEKNLRAAARSLGFTDGEPHWMPGHRVISQS